ncbi:hypothetical protein MVI01_59160 [Myxococcus virescens]|uniref:Uncharacterized protein n=1 Tax=Myxococcus virescens TaxID=83456 RepID=A0A511HKN3_9BACT|nr:hypothetical protein MVI01_59160 [Myxococcus virescens]
MTVPTVNLLITRVVAVIELDRLFNGPLLASDVRRAHVGHETANTDGGHGKERRGGQPRHRVRPTWEERAAHTWTMGKGASTTALVKGTKGEAWALPGTGSGGAFPAPLGRVGGSSWRTEGEADTSNETSISNAVGGALLLSLP